MGQTFCALWMRSGAFRAQQMHVREQQHNGTPVTLHLGLVCHLCTCQVSEMFSASPRCMVWCPRSQVFGETSPNTKLSSCLSSEHYCLLLPRQSLRLWKLLVSDAGVSLNEINVGMCFGFGLSRGSGGNKTCQCRRTQQCDKT